MVRFNWGNRSKGTEMLNSTSDSSRAVTMSSLKNALSMRTSMITPGYLPPKGEPPLPQYVPCSSLKPNPGDALAPGPGPAPGPGM